VATLLEEYFSGGDLGEAAAELADMSEPELQHFLVKRAVTAALDKHNREREMTSVLLSSLYSEARFSALHVGYQLTESVTATSSGRPHASSSCSRHDCRHNGNHHTNADMSCVHML